MATMMSASVIEETMVVVVDDLLTVAAVMVVGLGVVVPGAGVGTTGTTTAGLFVSR